MKKIDLKNLTVDKSLDCYICHGSGELLHRPGETLTLSHLTIMEECGINSIIILDKDEDPDAYKRKAQQKVVNLKDINPDEECPVTLFDKNGSTVVEEGAIIKQELLSDLEANKIKELYYQKDKIESQSFQYEKYTTLLQSDAYESIGSIHKLEHPKEKVLREEERKKESVGDTKEPTPFDFKNLVIRKPLMCLNPSAELSTKSLKQEMQNRAKLRRKLSKPSFKTVVMQIINSRDKQIKVNYIERYNMWLGKLQDIFNNFKQQRPVTYEMIDKLAKEIIESFAEDSYFVLNLTNMRLSPSMELYIASHCVNVCILSIGIASVCGYGPEQVLEIAIGALMHDIGHQLTYRPLFNKNKLDSSEQQKFDQHAIHGVALLKNISSIPKSTAFIIYQHHEKINGSGRILHCTGDLIHDFSKIVTVADTYDILAGENTPFKAMSAILNKGKSQLLEMIFIKAFLISMSLFPIGSLILLSDNKVAKVVGTNGNNFKQPVLRTLWRMEAGQMFELEKAEVINSLSQSDIHIIKEVSHSLLNKDTSKGF